MTVSRRAAVWLSRVPLALAFCTTTAHAQLPTVRVAPTIAVSGSNIALQMTLPSPAPAAGVPLRLSSSNPAAAVFVSSGSGSLSTTIPGGQTTLAVSIRTLGVAVPTSVVFTVATSVGSLRTSLTVNPASVSGVAVQQTTGPGGTERQGTVTLNGVGAAGNGTSVALTLSDPAVGAVPATVTVPAGLRSTRFQMLTQPVATVTSASISATTGDGTVAKGALTLTPPTLRAVTLTPARVIGGTAFSGTITLDAPASASGVSVTFATSPTTNVLVLRDVVIPPRATQAPFSIATTTVSARVDAVLSATATSGAAAGGVTTAFSVVPLDVAGVSASALHVFGGDVTDITVRLSGTAVRDQTVALRAEQTGGAVTTIPLQLPASVTIPAGNDRVSLRVATQVVASPMEYRLVAGAPGAAATSSNSVHLGVHARPLVRTISISPAPVVSTQSAGITVQLAWPVGPTFATTPVLPPSLVTLTSDSPLIPPGPALPVAYLQSELRTTLPVGATATTGAVLIGARSGTSEVKAIVNVVAPPVAVSAIQLAVSSLMGGSSTTGTLILSRAADAAGLTVSMTSNSTALTVPAKVQIPGGARQVAFSLTTAAGTAQQTATITAVAPDTPPASASVRITRLNVTGVRPSASALYGGLTPLELRVDLSEAAPASGAIVHLSTSLAGVTLSNGAPLPANVTVPAGRTSESIALRVPSVTAVSALVLLADVVTSASTASASAVASPAIQVVPAPGGLEIRRAFEVTDVDRFTGRMVVELAVTTGVAVPAGVATLLPPYHLVIESDHPELVRPDTVLFIPNTGVYERTLRVTSPASDAIVNVRAVTPLNERSRITRTITVEAPRLMTMGVSPTSVSGGDELQLVARLTRSAGPAGVSGVFTIQGVPHERFWAAGADELRTTIPTRLAVGNSNQSLSGRASSAVVGGVSSSKVAEVTILGTAVVDLLNNGASTLLAGESTQLSARLQNPTPFIGFLGVEFRSSDPAVRINGLDRNVVMPPPRASNAVQNVQAASLAAIPATTRLVTVSAQSIHATNSGVQSQQVVVVTPPDLQSLTASVNSVAGGSAISVTVRITPYQIVNEASLIAIPIRVESSHPSVIPPFTATMRLDGSQATASVNTLRPTSTTRVTLMAVVAGKTVSTVVVVTP